METAEVVGMRAGGRSVAEVQLFREDAVRSAAKPSMVGVVARVGGVSDSEDSEEDSEYEDDDGFEGSGEVESGWARVSWINGVVTTVQLADLRVIDRSFLHGDVVATAEDPLGQTGTVVSVDVMVDLEHPNGEITRDTNSRTLRRVQAFAVGDYVVRDMWLGRVEDVLDDVTVLFDDSAKCRVSKADPDRLVPVAGPVLDDGGCPYYQGQRVRCDSATVFKNAKWLEGRWKPDRVEGTVVNLEVGSVIVDWIVEGYCLGNLRPSAAPSEEQDAAKLLPVIHFSHANWQVGDRSLPTTAGSSSQGEALPSEDDADCSTIVTRSLKTVDLNCGGTCKGGNEARPSHRRKAKQQPQQQQQQPRRPARREKLQKRDNPEEQALLVARTRTMVDVVWQDASVSSGVDACSLVPVDHLDDHDFWPDQYVMERDADGEGLDLGHRRVGVVKSVDAKQRTAAVRWLKALDQPEDPLEFESEEVVSVYAMIEHPIYTFAVGDIVIRSTPGPSPAEYISPNELGNSSDTEYVSGADHGAKETSASGPRLSKQKRVNRKRKNRVAKSSSLDLSWVGTIIGMQAGSIEVAWADGVVSKVGPQAIIVIDGDIDDSSSAESSDFPASADSWETLPSADEFSGELRSRPEGCVEGLLETREEVGRGESVEPAKVLPEAVTEISDFKHFDCVKDPSDHYYVGEVAQPVNRNRWAKKIQQEWNMLERNLPDTIYVRVYEDRMDLLRAVIVGAAGTPYHDGLFVFDLYLPPDYPSVPPVAHYHSGGLRLNPNLYENGKVCLSLLHTWSGKGTEIWHPSTSNILQVLVSIQGLVLNEKPYYNEAGYEKQVGTGEGEKNSLLYNENSYLLSCKSMLYLLRRPQRHFEEFIRNHFRQHGRHVLLACKAYLADAVVGTFKDSDLLDAGENTSNVLSANQSSAGFKLMLEKLIPKLAAAFKEVGVNVSAS